MVLQATERESTDRGEIKSEPLCALIHEVLDELHPGQQCQITLTSSLDYDLGFDSLGRVELMARVERTFGVTLSHEQLHGIETPLDLLNALNSSTESRITWRAGQRHEKLSDVTESTPQHAETLPEVLSWYVDHYPDRRHITFYQDEGDGPSLTYRQLETGAKRVAAGLQAHGVEKGQCVAIMLPTSIDYFFSYFGIQLAGAVPVPLYPPARKNQLEDHLQRQSGILNNCQAVMLITVPEAILLAHLVKAQTPELHEVITVDHLQTTSHDFVAPEIRTTDTAFLQYTSGSTGDPKGVTLTHANLLANVRADGEAVKANHNDVFISWLPLYHDMGLIGAWLGSLYFAIPLVIMSPLDFLARPERWLWAIHRYHGTLSAAPNFAFELCLLRVLDEDIQGLDLSSWRVAFNGAEPVDPKTVTGFCRRYAEYGFKNEAMYPVYGLAESSVGLAFPPLGQGVLIDRIDRDHFMQSGEARPTDSDQGALLFTASGRPLARHEIRIVDDAGHELPERHEGLLEFRGPSATSGYYRNPEATKGLFNGDWLNSGDRAYFAGADLFITGRIKDIIILAGRNIYPQELEEAVGEVDGIRRGRVVAFGSQRERMATERLVIIAESRAPVEQHASLRHRINEIVTDLTGGAADEVVLAPPGTVLKTSSGKVRRDACRQRYEAGDIAHKPAAVWWQILHLTLTGFAVQLRRFSQRMRSLLYAAYSLSLFAVAVPFSWAILLLVPDMQRRWSLLGGAARGLFALAGIKLTLSGQEHLQQLPAPYVIAVNHASLLDAYLLVATLPKAAAFLVKAELKKGFFSSRFLNRLRVEFVERGDFEESIESAERSLNRLQQGDNLLFFAEGTFRRQPGLLAFHMGAFVTAARANVPLVPVAIRGTRSILLADTWWPRRGDIEVSIGEPLIRDEGVTDWQAAQQLRDAARQFILQHCGEEDMQEVKSPLLTDNPHE
ncbi:MAG: AMP-binding protein [Candidatus Polarisedimenticolaceae bacterium]|nr:AMP-binding protein [Candidatus Polarisedimenticolaceae bacterium]